MKILKKYLYLFFLLAATISAFFIFFYTPHDPNKPDVTIVKMAGRSFSIPREYFQIRVARDMTLDTHAININFALPDFSSSGIYTDGEKAKLVSQERRSGSLLLEDIAKRPPISKFVENRQKLNAIGKKIGTEDGLDVYLNSDVPREQKYKFYIEKDNGVIISYITCKMNSPLPHSNCRHVFENKGLKYNVSYDAPRYFKNWREWREKAIQMVDGWEIQSDRGKPQ